MTKKGTDISEAWNTVTKVLSVRYWTGKSLWVIGQTLWPVQVLWDVLGTRWWTTMLLGSVLFPLTVIILLPLGFLLLPVIGVGTWMTGPGILSLDVVLHEYVDPADQAFIQALVDEALQTSHVETAAWLLGIGLVVGWPLLGLPIYAVGLLLRFGGLLIAPEVTDLTDDHGNMTWSSWVKWFVTSMGALLGIMLCILMGQVLVEEIHRLEFHAVQDFMASVGAVLDLVWAGVLSVWFLGFKPFGMFILDGIASGHWIELLLILVLLLPALWAVSFIGRKLWAIMYRWAKPAIQQTKEIVKSD